MNRVKNLTVQLIISMYNVPYSDRHCDIEHLSWWTRLTDMHDQYRKYSDEILGWATANIKSFDRIIEKSSKHFANNFPVLSKTVLSPVSILNFAK